MGLYDCKWFTRLWIVREVSHAKLGRHTAYSGAEHIDAYKLTVAARLLVCGNYATFSVVESRGVWCARILYETCNYPPGGGSFGLHLSYAGVFHCLNPRDKVFGLLGLLDSDDRRLLDVEGLIEPDYTKSVMAVYRDISRALIMLCGIAVF